MFSILVSGLAATVTLAQAQTTDAEVMAAFREVFPLVLQGDWEAAEPVAEAALPLATAPMNRYRIRHILTDTHARLGKWEDAATYAREAAETIYNDEALSQRLMLMASHMAAEEARAAYMLGDMERVAEANGRMISDHPDAGPGWTASGVTGAAHTAGLDCELMRDGYLRFDVWGGDEGLPACDYWALSDIGLRLTQGPATAAEIARLSERRTDAAPRELAWDEAPEGVRLTAYNLGTPAPGKEDEYAVILEGVDAGWTVTVRYPASQQAEALSALSGFYIAGPQG
ncbi:hypothetical protein [Maricaulis sp.]|uniref:hypothetical protein n=1 Tax=Maricaulis sp. TaxID=1486257 RepID=UPI002627402E|nr:hypothetical protein [Maricaulis sp.]